MKAQAVKQMIRYQEWAAQINDRNQSGLTVRQWCEAHGIGVKTYYHRLKRVREELLDALEPQQFVLGTGASEINAPALHEPEIPGVRPGIPLTFAALPMPQAKESAMTVRMGGYVVEIQNGAAGALVEQVLRLVSRL